MFLKICTLIIFAGLINPLFGQNFYGANAFRALMLDNREYYTFDASGSESISPGFIVGGKIQKTAPRPKNFCYFATTRDLNVLNKILSKYPKDALYKVMDEALTFPRIVDFDGNAVVTCNIAVSENRLEDVFNVKKRLDDYILLSPLLPGELTRKESLGDDRFLVSNGPGVPKEIHLNDLFATHRQKNSSAKFFILAPEAKSNSSFLSPKLGFFLEKASNHHSYLLYSSLYEFDPLKVSTTQKKNLIELNFNDSPTLELLDPDGKKHMPFNHGTFKYRDIVYAFALLNKKFIKVYNIDSIQYKHRR